MLLSPGKYLRKRREAAALGVQQAAANLAALPWAIRPARPEERARLALRLTAAEEDLQPFTRAEAETVCSVFRFDVEVYFQLLAGEVIPRLCSSCACSWHDPCAMRDSRFPGRVVGCSWAAPDLCTACVADVRVAPVEVVPEQVRAA